MIDHLHRALPGVVLVLLACASGCAAESADEEDVDETASSLTNDELESQIIAEVNKKRVARGLQKVAGGSCVDGFAEKWAGHLVATNTFYHQDMGPLLSCGALWAGEAMGAGSKSVTASQWVTLWMNSPAHRDIILKPRADRIGVGVRTRPSGDIVVVADFIDKPNE